MNKNWPIKNISDVANFLNHKRIPIKSLEREKMQGSYPYYGASGIVDYLNNYIFDGTYLLVSEDGENLRSRNTPIAFKATGKFWVNNHAHILEEKEQGILDYLKFYFSVLNINPYITGAVQPKLNKANLDSIEIPIPLLDERLAICNILNSFEDKIQLNQQINQTLEEMAQALFKSWFVDFEPTKAKIAALEAGGSEEDANLAAMQAISGKTTSELEQLKTQNPENYQQLYTTAQHFPAAMQESELGEIPEGWEVLPASALIKFNPKELLRKGTVAPYLDMASLPTSGSWPESPVPREFGSGMRFRNGDALLARITPCLENGKSAFVQNLPDESVGWGSTEFIVMRSKKPIPQVYAYLLARHTTFREHAIRSMTGTSGRQRAQANTVAEFKVVAPLSNSVWCAFSEIVEPLFKGIKSKYEASETLVNLRDTLLPKLLSGELSVTEGM